VEWQPIALEQSGDAAVLRLDKPVTFAPAPLAFPVHVQGHRFSVHGFPDGDNAARQASGRLGGASGPTGQWIQLNADSAVGWPVGHGFSGAPVFDHGAAAVAGIVVMTDAYRSAHMLPMSALRSWWPQRLNRPADNSSWQAHWLPRARGSEPQSDTGGWFFTGRVAARQRVCDWLADDSQPALVVTGGPGTGKSALLAHLLVTSDPVWADTVPTGGPRPPIGAFDLAIHVSGLSCEVVVQRVANAVGQEMTDTRELLAAMRQRREDGHPVLVIMADAVEEAISIDEARNVAVLLRNLAGTGAVRVLAGVRTAPVGSERAKILGAFGNSIPLIPLEDREFQRNEDVADYVRDRLTGDDPRDQYHSLLPGEMRKICWAVARRARYNFLIAQLTTLWLTQATTPPLDLAHPDWEHRLPETVGEAMEGYLSHCGADSDLVHRILTALAFAHGSGLPLGRTWLAMSDAISPVHAHTEAELETVFHSTANYLLERTDDRHNRPTYRLYHHALDEHLRDHCTRYTTQRNPLPAITRALIDAVPGSEADRRDWALADIYTRTHLAGHAAEADKLDDVLNDPGFLVYADPGPLFSSLHRAHTEEGQLTAAVYRLSEHLHRHAGPFDRCRILGFDAARLGCRDLHNRLIALQDHLTEDNRVSWRACFATASEQATPTIATLTGHTGGVTAVAVAELDGRPIAITSGKGVTARIWDLTEQRVIGTLTHDGHPVTAVGVTVLHGYYPRAITSGKDKTQVWDLARQRVTNTFNHYSYEVVVAEPSDHPVAIVRNSGKAMLCHFPSGQVINHNYNLFGSSSSLTGVVNAVAVGELDGHPIAIGSGNDKTEIRDLYRDLYHGRATERAGGAFTHRGHRVKSVAAAELDGRLVAITGGMDAKIRIWDLAGHRALGTSLVGHTGEVTAVAVAELDGRPIAITGGEEETVRMWDLAEQRALGTLAGHTGGVTAVAVAELDGRPIAITSGMDKNVRIWDLAEQRALGALSDAGHVVNAVAVAELDGRPIAITGGMDAKIRIWDLAEQRALGTLAGHPQSVDAVAVAVVDGRLVAITGGIDTTVRMWDLAEQRAVGAFAGHTRPVTTAAVAELDGRPIAITGGEDKTVRIWDLTEQCAIGAPLLGHAQSVNAVAVAELDGRPIAITGDMDAKIRIWDIKDRCPTDEIVMPEGVRDLTLGTRGMLVVAFGSDIAAFDPSVPLIVRSMPQLPFPAHPQETFQSSSQEQEQPPPRRRGWWHRIARL
jgi:WD40 repeat protein